MTSLSWPSLPWGLAGRESETLEGGAARACMRFPEGVTIEGLPGGGTGTSPRNMVPRRVWTWLAFVLTLSTGLDAFFPAGGGKSWVGARGEPRAESPEGPAPTAHPTPARPRPALEMGQQLHPAALGTDGPACQEDPALGGPRRLQDGVLLLTQPPHESPTQQRQKSREGQWGPGGRTLREQLRRQAPAVTSPKPALTPEAALTGVHGLGGGCDQVEPPRGPLPEFQVTAASPAALGPAALAVGAGVRPNQARAEGRGWWGPLPARPWA